MSHVLKYASQYFRIEITALASADNPQKATYIGWVSDPFKQLEDMPNHVCSRMIDGQPVATHDEALRHAYDWIKSDWDARQAKRVYNADNRAAVIYTVRIFQGGSPIACQFEEFADAKAFARTAEKIMDIEKVGITNNESPEYLAMWERAT